MSLKQIIRTEFPM